MFMSVLLSGSSDRAKMIFACFCSSACEVLDHSGVPQGAHQGQPLVLEQLEQDGHGCHPPSHPSQDAAMPPNPSPTYERLRQTIVERMRMSPNGQPLML